MGIEQKLTTYFSKQTEVIAVYLFGSYAKGCSRANSDMDLAVLCDSDYGKEELFRLELKYFRELSKIIAKNLDIVLLNQAGELLVYEIVSKGRLIYQRNPRKRVDFEARRISDYLEFAPMMNRMINGMMNKLKE
ncbi:MAG: nucleotidyltransferase domain-containing protein, partial [bacterium]